MGNFSKKSHFFIGPFYCIENINGLTHFNSHVSSRSIMNVCRLRRFGDMTIFGSWTFAARTGWAVRLGCGRCGSGCASGSSERRLAEANAVRNRVTHPLSRTTHPYSVRSCANATVGGVGGSQKISHELLWIANPFRNIAQVKRKLGIFCPNCNKNGDREIRSRSSGTGVRVTHQDRAEPVPTGMLPQRGSAPAGKGARRL